MSMRLEVINTGTELLLGDTLNTHLSWLGGQLLPLGLRIGRQLAIPDGDIIREAITESVGRADIVIVTGGLGPTSDDITRELTADLLGLPLHENGGVLAAIALRFSKRNREMNAHTRRQAMVPEKATVLPNEHGTAPGLYFPPLPVETCGGALSPHLFLLPGPPRELKPMFTSAVVPLLQIITAGQSEPRQMKNFRLCNLGETQVSTTVESTLLALGIPELGYCAKAGEVVVRVLGNREQMAQAESVIAAAFPGAFYSSDDSNMEQTVVRTLMKMGRSISAAESCTGGYLSHLITSVPGASAIFGRAFVTYANEAKCELLGVDPALIASHGAVSRECAGAMASGCLAASRADYALSVTGIAGPGGGSPEKPVGTVFISLAGLQHPHPVVEQHYLPFERASFKHIAATLALDLLRRRLLRILPD